MGSNPCLLFHPCGQRVVLHGSISEFFSVFHSIPVSCVWGCGCQQIRCCPVAPTWPCSVSQLGLPPPSVPQHPVGRSGEHSVVCSRLSGSAEPQMWAEWAAAWRAQAGETATRDPALHSGAGGGGWRRPAAEGSRQATCVQSSSALWAAMPRPLPPTPSSVWVPRCKKGLKSQGPPPSSSPMPGSILPQGLCTLGPPALGLLFHRYLLLPNHARSYPHPSQSALDLRLTKALVTLDL